MQKNLDRLGGLVHSQRVMLALTQKGVAREDAYRLVQRNAMPVWQGEGDFLAFLKADKDVRKHMSEAELEAELRPRLSPRACRHDLQAGVRQDVLTRDIRTMIGATRVTRVEEQIGFASLPPEGKLEPARQSLSQGSFGYCCCCLMPSTPSSSGRSAQRRAAPIVALQAIYGA